MKTTPLFMILLFGIGLGSQAAAESSRGAAQTAWAEIVFVQGDDLLLLRSGGQALNEDPIGIRLYAGDQVQSGAKTSVELVVMPRRSRIRLSENTVVTIGALGNDGSTTLKLLYGRLRSKVAKIAGSPTPFRVVSQTFVAGVRGTDFGCDVLVARSGEKPSVRVYCFEGSVEVGPSISEPEALKTGFTPVLVSAGAMAVIGETDRGKTIDIVEKPIDAETKSYWKTNDFSQAEPAGMMALESSNANPEALIGPAFDLTPIRKGIKAKNTAIAGAGMFFTIGTALEVASLIIRDKDPTIADGLMRGGAICAATGIPVLIYSITINPLRGEKHKAKP